MICYKLTGLPLVINTSFNVHEEGLKSVIVCQDYICKLK